MAICLAVMPALQSCDDDDDHFSVGDFTPPLWATVRTSGTAFYLNCDVWGTLWPTNTNLGWYEPVEGQRVITSFNPLWKDYEGYDYAVRLLSLQNVLTKQLDTLTPETEEELGDDPMYILKGDISISGGYLNVIFIQDLPASTKHRISLVRPQDDNELYAADGYIHLELRYNDYDDRTGRRAYGAVSFNLGSLNITEATKGIKLKLNSEVNGEVEVVFEKSEQGDNTSDKQAVELSNTGLK